MHAFVKGASAAEGGGGKSSPSVSKRRFGRSKVDKKKTSNGKLNKDKRGTYVSDV